MHASAACADNALTMCESCIESGSPCKINKHYNFPYKAMSPRYLIMRMGAADALSIRRNAFLAIFTSME